MGYFIGNDIYGIRWWILQHDDNDDNFINRMKYMEKYDSIMTKEQIQNAKTEFEKLSKEEMEKVLVQVFVYNKYSNENTWWHINKEDLKILAPSNLFL
jgi:hypothetical protein